MIDDLFFPDYVAMDKEEKERQRKEKARERRRRLNLRKRQFLKRAKEDRGCQRCGIKDVRVLDFYNRHGPGVTMRRAASLSWDQIYEGLENCFVLCGNCRRIAMWEDRHDAAIH
jgi:hypothetical protein